jgi:hypothetical protein
VGEDAKDWFSVCRRPGSILVQGNEEFAHLEQEKAQQGGGGNTAAWGRRCSLGWRNTRPGGANQLGTLGFLSVSALSCDKKYFLQGFNEHRRPATWPRGMAFAQLACEPPHSTALTRQPSLLASTRVTSCFSVPRAISVSLGSNSRARNF